MYKAKRVESTVQVKEPVNHIVIFDRSGSMWGTLSSLIDDLQERVEEMNLGDTVSAAWFSSEGGQFEWLVKAHVITDKSVKFLTTLLDKYRQTVAMTCFSEVIESIEAVLDVVEGYNKTNNLVFLTDGHPVVRDTAKEEQKTLKALERMAKRFSNALFIGYGSYYNKPFMAKMAEAVGGTLVSANARYDITHNLRDFFGQAEPLLAIGLETGQAFYITSGGVYNAKVENNTVYVPASTQYVYYEADNGDDEDEALYAAAYLKMTAAKADEALEILGKLGDVALIDMVNTAFTNEEYGKAEQAILKATLDPMYRFIKGRNTNYLPDPNAFCLLDLLDILASNDGVYFLPRHPDFQYKRTGVRTTKREGYPDFIEDAEQRVPFNTLVWHGSRANVSIQARIKGYVDLGAEAQLYGLPSHFRCEQVRNYTLIKDGVVNVEKLVVEIPESVQPLISMNGEYLSNNIFVLDLTSIPVINKKIADNLIGTVQEYLDLAEEELALEAGQKVYKYFRDLLNPNKVDVGSEYNEQQQIFLREKGIVKGIYSPPTDAEGFEDVYLALEVVLQKKGYSSFPSVEKVKEAVISGGKLNGPGTLMADFVKDAVSMGLPALESRLAAVKKDLYGIRKPMQQARFAIIVGHKWFSDIGREAQVGEWVIKLKTTEVKF